MQVKQLIEQQYPGMQVVGSNYPVSPIKQAAAQAVSIAQMGGFAMVIFGDKVFDSLGVPPPQFYTQNVANNRFGAGVGLWFVGNLIQNQLVSTGAFEVYYDGSLVGFAASSGSVCCLNVLSAVRPAAECETLVPQCCGLAATQTSSSPALACCNDVCCRRGCLFATRHTTVKVVLSLGHLHDAQQQLHADWNAHTA
eukprot:GHUV01034442.1.p1 GENE.GHUV01034442.1~~GHUV01034442.1.p1  ORF type:complete len:196 (+),score=46.05 GHUV01034442.1:135-722(+)